MTQRIGVISLSICGIVIVKIETVGEAGGGDSR